MNELLLIVAMGMPEDILLSEVEKDLTAHLQIKTDETRKKLTTSAMLLVTKFTHEGRKIEDVMKEVARFRAASNLLVPNEM